MDGHGEPTAPLSDGEMSYASAISKDTKLAHAYAVGKAQRLPQTVVQSTKALYLMSLSANMRIPVGCLRRTHSSSQGCGPPLSRCACQACASARLVFQGTMEPIEVYVH